MNRPQFTIGIEEEYLLVDRDTTALAVAPEGFMDACRSDLADQVSPEFLQCQVEVGTRVCGTVGAARDDLKRLRSVVSQRAGEHGLAPIAASCHPSADWKDQSHTPKQRYNELDRDMAAAARRLLICGCHVHVGIDDDGLRIDLMRQLSYFLPHMLAMSTSSPFWQGQDTGLASYRISVFDNLPRTGLPPDFTGWLEYQREVLLLINLGLVEDASKIWWDVRPSASYPTLETRIMDVSPRLEDTITLAATIQSLLRMLWRLRVRNQRWRTYGRFMIGENRWRAQRYGVSEGLIDFGAEEVRPFPQLIAEMLDLIEEDARALGCLAEVERVRDIAENGTSADRQRAVAREAESAGASRDEAMAAVVHHLVEEFHRDL